MAETKSFDLDAAAIAHCDREPIHIPGATQSFGALIAVDQGLDQVLFASSNVDAYLGEAAPAVLAASLPALLDPKVMHAVRNVAGHSTIAHQREHVARAAFAPGVADVTMHRSEDRFVLEFMRPAPASDANPLTAIDQVRATMAKAETADAVQDLLETAVRGLRGISHYDRVKAYRFLPDGSGEVVAEARAAHAQSYQGLRYPAWDIPTQARAIYRNTPIRIIADVNTDNLPLLAASEALGPLDMSLSLVRGCSPVHLQYLQNMGVSATMSLPIVIDGQLWGLFAFHHYAPMHPDPEQAMALELAGKLWSMTMQRVLSERREHVRRTVLDVSGALSLSGDSELAVGRYWNSTGPTLDELIFSHGMVLSVDGRLEQLGDVPDDDAIATLLERLDGEGAVIAVDSLSERFADVDWSGAGGALCLFISHAPQIALIYFRNQIVQEIQWAGMPDKTIEGEGPGAKLTPRHSFERYIELREGGCDAWTADEIDVAKTLQRALFSVNLSAREVKDQRHRLGLMVHELNHRARNMLALIRSLSSQSKLSARSLEDYVSALEKRISALSNAHDLLTETASGGVALRDILRTELAPFVHANALDEAVQGPNVTIRPEATNVVALVMHELTSNAVKYGALSDASGKVRVRWTSDDDGVAIRWMEQGGPPVAAPTRSGFGRSVIERAFAYELDGRSSLHFEKAGVIADLWLPQAAVIANGAADGGAPKGGGAVTDGDAEAMALDRVIGDRVLIVEDNFLLAAEIESLVREVGYTVVDAAATTREALLLLNKHNYQIAILDINLRGEQSFPIAKRLKRDGVSFIFVSGYGDTSTLPEEYADAPILTKPVSLSTLAKYIKK